MTKFPDAPPPSRSDDSQRSHKSWDLNDSKKSNKEFKHPQKPHLDPKHADPKAKISPDRPFRPDKHHDKKTKDFDMDKDVNLSPDKSYRPRHPDRHPDRFPDKKAKNSDFALPFDRRKDDLIKPKNGDSKEDKKKSDKDNKVDPQAAVGQVITTDNKSSEIQTTDVKTSEISPADAQAAAQRIRETILKMVSNFQVGTVEGKTIQRVELKETTDVPSFLQGASVSVVRDAPGKISVSISNLSSVNEALAIKAIESQTAELQKLVKDLAAKQITITELRIGEHAIVPRIEAPTPTPFAAAMESFSDRRREHGEGGSGGKGGDRGGGEGQKEGREKQ